MRLAIAALSILASCGGPPPAPPVKADPPKIVQFYASPTPVPRGSPAQLCWGTEGAEALRLSPPVEEVKPSLARCIEVTPAATAQYTLFARGKSGDEVSATATLAVGPAEAGGRKQTGAKMIQLFTAPVFARAGEKFTVCYGVQGAASVEFQPKLASLPMSDRLCFTASIDKTTTVKLLARDASGRSESETITIKVN